MKVEFTAYGPEGPLEMIVSSAPPPVTMCRCVWVIVVTDPATGARVSHVVERTIPASVFGVEHGD